MMMLLKVWRGSVNFFIYFNYFIYYVGQTKQYLHNRVEQHEYDYNEKTKVTKLK